MRLLELRADALTGDCIALSLKVQERLSHAPKYELEICSPHPDLDFDALIGQPLAIDVSLDQEQRRTFHTYVTEAYETGQLREQFTYRLLLGSWLDFLGQNQDCRIFQELSVPQIVEAVFKAQGCRDYRFDLMRNYEPREYCVQFRETDLNFVLRLLEDEGLYFHIEHETDRHVVTISDMQQFKDLPETYAHMRFLPDGEENRAIAGLEGVQRLQRKKQMRPKNVVLRDFDYHMPSNRLEVDAQLSSLNLAGTQLEYYDYATGYRDIERGEWLAKIRLEAIQADAHMLAGRSNARALAVGRAFTLEGHPDASRNRRFHITDTELSFVQDVPNSSSAGYNVTASFRALEDDRPFHPLCITPKPAVPGIQSATVVGPEGSEVHTDKLGRIRVHFHWDRYKSTEHDASCWIRVSQAWAGKGWGVLAMPRVGQEVLVTYVDGDLDRPLSVGIVYNGENPTPYELPKHIRYTGIVSRSHRFGRIEHASQLTFDDQRGQERVMLHAERDMQHTVERNTSTSVGKDLNISVKGTSTSITGVDISLKGISIGFTGIAVSYQGIAIAKRGLAMTFTGLNTSFTGINTSGTGVNTSFNGINTSFNGVNTAFNGVTTAFNGVATSINGLTTSIHGESRSMAGQTSSFVGTADSMTGTATAFTGTSTRYTGTSTSFTGSDTSTVGTALSMTGTRTAFVGSSTAMTGTNMAMTGSSTSITGSSTSMTGSSTSVTGSSTSITGSSTSITGNQTSITGMQILQTGMRESYVGVKHDQHGMEIKS